MAGQLNNSGKDFNNIIGNTLRYGVWIALSLSAIGLIVFLYQNGFQIFSNAQLIPTPSKFSFNEMLQGLIHFDPIQIMMSGIFVLLITPLLRVIFALFIYWKEGNRLYTLITLIVIAIIIISIFIGAKH